MSTGAISARTIRKGTMSRGTTSVRTIRRGKINTGAISALTVNKIRPSITPKTAKISP
jgi:hypothetical protein